MIVSEFTTPSGVLSSSIHTRVGWVGSGRTSPSARRGCRITAALCVHPAPLLVRVGARRAHYRKKAERVKPCRHRGRRSAVATIAPIALTATTATRPTTAPIALTAASLHANDRHGSAPAEVRSRTRMRPPRRRRGRAPVGLDRSRGSRGLPESRSRRGGGVGEPDVEGSASTISTPVPPPVSLVPPTRLPPVPSETTHDTGISDATRSASANAATPFHRPLRSTRSLRSIGVVVAVGFAVGPDHTRLFTARKVIGHEASTSGLTSCRTETARQYGRRFRRSNVMRTPSCRSFCPDFHPAAYIS